MNSSLNRPEPTILAFRKWLADAGVSSTTGWRWQKRGWITTVNIAGRPYVTAEEIEKFRTRAINGEFAQPATGAAAVQDRNTISRLGPDGGASTPAIFTMSSTLNQKPEA